MVCSRSADKVDPVAWRGGRRWLGQQDGRMIWAMMTR